MKKLCVHGGIRRRCLACKAAYMRSWRQSHAMTNYQRMKDNCRSYAGVYLRRGLLKREPCQICGARAEMHHADYAKPLEVTWLCRWHHLELKRNLLTAKQKSKGVQAHEEREERQKCETWNIRPEPRLVTLSAAKPM